MSVYFLVGQRPNPGLGAVTDLSVLSHDVDSRCILLNQPQLWGAITTQRCWSRLSTLCFYYLCLCNKRFRWQNQIGFLLLKTSLPFPVLLFDYVRAHSRERYPHFLLWNWWGAYWFLKLNLFSDFIYTQLCQTAWSFQTWGSLLWRHRRIWHFITLNSGNQECTLLPFAQHKWLQTKIKLQTSPVNWHDPRRWSIWKSTSHFQTTTHLPSRGPESQLQKTCLTLNRKACLLGLFGIAWLFCHTSQPRVSILAEHTNVVSGWQSSQLL